MADRWATDQLTADEACQVTLSAADLHKITGKTRLSSGRNSILIVSKLVSIRTEIDGDFTRINWPKFAEYQGWDARERGEAGAREALASGQSAPAPSPAPSPAPLNQEKLPIESEGIAASPPLTQSNTAVIQMRADPFTGLVAGDFSRLVNLLGGQKGTREDKLAWLDDGNADLLVAEIAKMNLITQGENIDALRVLMIRYWRHHLNHRGENAPHESFDERRDRRNREFAQGKYVESP